MAKPKAAAALVTIARAVADKPTYTDRGAGLRVLALLEAYGNAIRFDVPQARRIVRRALMRDAIAAHRTLVGWQEAEHNPRRD